MDRHELGTRRNGGAGPVALSEALGIDGGVVCAVGAGGKKTLLYRLAAEAGARDYAITASVMTTPPPMDLVDAAIHAADARRLAAEVEARRAAGARRIAYALDATKPGRWAGVPPALIARLHRDCRFHLTLVKADGARMRGIKAPRDGEPVLVPGTDVTVVHVVSASVVGRPLDEDTAHRVERLAAITGRAAGEPLTAADLGRLLAHPEGARRGLDGRRPRAVINQVDDDDTEAVARRAAEHALRLDPALGRVLLTDLRRERPVRAVIHARSGA